MKILMRFLTPVLAACLLFAAFPATPASALSPSSPSNQTISDSYEAAAKEVLIHVRDGVPNYSAVKVNQTVTAEFLNEFTVGWLVQNGKVSGMGSRAKELTSLADDLSACLGTDSMHRTTCKGVNGYKLFWPTVRLDSCKTNTILNMISGGAGAATVAGAIGAAISATGPAAPVAASIAGLAVCKPRHHQPVSQKRSRREPVLQPLVTQRASLQSAVRSSHA